MLNIKQIARIAIIAAVGWGLAGCVGSTTGPSATGSGPSVNVGYIAARAGQLDVEVIQRLPSSSQIGWLDENLSELQTNGQLATGMQIHLIAYAYERGPVLWENVSISTGEHRVAMPKAIARQTGLFCVRVYGHNITNVENLQVRSDGSTSWCDADFASYVDLPWMQGSNGGYGWPLITEKM